MPDLQLVLEALKTLGVAGGPASLIAVLWWMERTERKAAQAETKELLVQRLAIASQAATSIDEVTKAVATLGDSSKDMAELIRVLLGARLKGGVAQ